MQMQLYWQAMDWPLNEFERVLLARSHSAGQSSHSQTSKFEILAKTQTGCAAIMVLPAIC